MGMILSLGKGKSENSACVIREWEAMLSLGNGEQTPGPTLLNEHERTIDLDTQPQA